MAVPDYSYHRAGLGDGPDKGSSASGLSLSLTCLKFGLYCYNILLLLFGLCGLSIGLWSLIDRGQFLSLLTNTVHQISGLVIVLTGALVILITVLGCCGISRESKRMITVYWILLGLMVLVQCIIGVSAYFYKDQVHRELVESLNISISEEYGLPGHEDSTRALDDLQVTFRCCGAEGFEDWRASAWWRSEARLSNKVPDTCCKTVSAQCGVRDHPSNVFYTGCAHKLARLARDHLILIGSIAIVICLVQSVGVFLGVKLVNKLKTVGD